MSRAPRPFTQPEREKLKRLWPTRLLDKQLEAEFKRSRSTLFAEASRLGLGSRKEARGAAGREVA